MRRLWLRFLGGFIVFGVIMSFVVMGFVKMKEYLDGIYFPEEIPSILRYGFVLIGVFNRLYPRNILGLGCFNKWIGSSEGEARLSPWGLRRGPPGRASDE